MHAIEQNTDVQAVDFPRLRAAVGRRPGSRVEWAGASVPLRRRMPFFLLATCGPPHWKRRIGNGIGSHLRVGNGGKRVRVSFVSICRVVRPFGLAPAGSRQADRPAVSSRTEHPAGTRTRTAAIRGVLRSSPDPVPCGTPECRTKRCSLPLWLPGASQQAGFPGPRQSLSPDSGRKTQEEAAECPSLWLPKPPLSERSAWASLRGPRSARPRFSSPCFSSPRISSTRFATTRSVSSRSAGTRPAGS